MDRAEGSDLKVEVAYSPEPRVVEFCKLQLAAGSTVRQAVEASGLLGRHRLTLDSGLTLAVWGRSVQADSLLREDDRVELLRALRVDPKEARRQRYRSQADRSAKPRK